MKIKNAYIIQTKTFFISDLFFKRNIKNQFNVFKSKSCLNDLIFSGHSNINIFDGRLWLNCGIADKLNFFDKKFIVDSWKSKKIYIPNFGNIRKRNEIEKFNNIKDFFKVLEIPHNKVNSLFIPYLGKIQYSNKVFPPISYNFNRHFYPKFKNTKGVLLNKSNVFGLSSNQSFSHIPLEIGNNIKIEFTFNHQKKNKIQIKDKIFQVNPKIKIQLTPYGLLSIHITYSITSNHYFSEKELIIIQQEVSSVEKIRFKKLTFNNTASLFNFIKKNVLNSILNDINSNEIIDFKSSMKLSFNFITEKNDYLNDDTLLTKKILGILNQDIHYSKYSENFVNSYSSLFGKYKNDFVFVKNNKLIYSLYDGCKKVLFNWEVSNTFDYFKIKKELNDYFRTKLIIIGAKEKLEKKDIKEIESIEIFLKNFNHYKNLSDPMRKLFNEINKSFSYNYDDKDNISMLNDLKSKIKNNNISDALILQPSFMGFGIDLMKLKRIFKKN